jgi:hypothetical protein
MSVPLLLLPLLPLLLMKLLLQQAQGLQQRLVT